VILIPFRDETRRVIYINPEKIVCLLEVGEQKTRVMLTDGHSFEFPVTVQEIEMTISIYLNRDK